MNKLKELEQKYKELGEEIERLKNQGKVWKPENKEEYFIIKTEGKADNSYWENDCYDKNRYEIGNCFKTREEAEAVAEKLKIYTQLKRLAEEINTEPIDWNNGRQDKYKIYLDEGAFNLCQDGNMGYHYHGVIYSTNKDFLKIAKQRIGEENLLKLFKED